MDLQSVSVPDEGYCILINTPHLDLSVEYIFAVALLSSALPVNISISTICTLSKPALFTSDSQSSVKTLCVQRAKLIKPSYTECCSSETCCAMQR